MFSFSQTKRRLASTIVNLCHRMWGCRPKPANLPYQQFSSRTPRGVLKIFAVCYCGFGRARFCQRKSEFRADFIPGPKKSEKQLISTANLAEVRKVLKGTSNYRAVIAMTTLIQQWSVNDPRNQKMFFAIPNWNVYHKQPAHRGWSSKIEFWFKIFEFNSMNCAANVTIISESGVS